MKRNINAELKISSMGILLTVMIVLIMLFQTSCGNRENQVIKVGVLYPMTGELADYGIDSIRAIEMAADEINHDGGIRSMGGAVIQLVYGDTAGNPETGAREAERLIVQEKVIAIIGTYQSSVTIQATQAAERLEVPFIVSISLADIITERGFRYTFRIQPKAQYYTRDQVEFLIWLSGKRNLAMKRVALLHENTNFGTATSIAQKRTLHQYGIEVCADAGYSSQGAKDLGPVVRRVLASKPDAILTVTYLNDSILIFREFARLGVKIPVVDTAGGTVSPEFIPRMGSLSENILTSAEFSKYTDEGRELNRRFNTRYGKDITGDSAYAYQSLWVLRDSIERAGTTGSRRLRDSIAATDMTVSDRMILPAERIRFDSRGQNEYARLFIVQIQQGEYIPVWPENFAAGNVKIER